MSVIANISTALPPYKHKQADLCAFMCDLHQYPEQKRRELQIMYAKSGIGDRYSAIPDYCASKEERVFFSKNRRS